MERNISLSTQEHHSQRLRVSEGRQTFLRILGSQKMERGTKQGRRRSYHPVRRIETFARKSGGKQGREHLRYRQIPGTLESKSHREIRTSEHKPLASSSAERRCRRTSSQDDPTQMTAQILQSVCNPKMALLSD